MGLSVPEPQRVLVTFSAELLAQAKCEVDATFPFESGGVLMGSWQSPTDVVVRAVIGPGPKAEHKLFAFRPDLTWQHEQIASHYLQSEGTVTYLGDWHSHPRAEHGRLSYRDQQALYSIMSTPEAQCPAPLMAILWGAPDAWSLSVWQALRGWVPPWRKVRLRSLHCAVAPSPKSADSAICTR